jgi:hypothetical protein
MKGPEMPVQLMLALAALVAAIFVPLVIGTIKTVRFRRRLVAVVGGYTLRGEGKEYLRVSYDPKTNKIMREFDDFYVKEESMEAGIGIVLDSQRFWSLTPAQKFMCGQHFAMLMDGKEIIAPMSFEDLQQELVPASR